METNQIKKIAAVVAVIAAANQGGFTWNIHEEKMQSHGFAVARAETQNSFNAEGLLRAVEFAVKNDIPCIGGWYDSESGLYYYDATEIFSNKDEAENAARENEQLAYFDLDNLAEIRI